MAVRYESHKSCGREGSYRVDFSADQTQTVSRFRRPIFSNFLDVHDGRNFSIGQSKTPGND